jgi:hypothetical protein
LTRMLPCKGQAGKVSNKLHDGDASTYRLLWFLSVSRPSYRYARIPRRLDDGALDRTEQCCGVCPPWAFSSLS